MFTRSVMAATIKEVSAHSKAEFVARMRQMVVLDTSRKKTRINEQMNVKEKKCIDRINSLESG